MTPDMHNDPAVILALAVLAWIAFAIVGRYGTRRGDVRNDHTTEPHEDAPRENEWRNRW